ncbi:MAG: LamG domain-containing protein, partial [Actinobacteria bacterium]|nr:LamG domain-containing protein [Actinomycetota bacterium]
DSTVGEATADAEHGLSAGDWAHVAAVWEPAGERLLLYLDGRMAAISAESVAPSFDSSDALVGADDNGAIENHLDGDLDDVRIYARELTVDEIAVLAAP